MTDTTQQAMKAGHDRWLEEQRRAAIQRVTEWRQYAIHEGFALRPGREYPVVPEDSDYRIARAAGVIA